MADIGQSTFLQSLGWATLNSFWQWAALWFLFVSLQHLFRFTPQKKYLLALLSISAGVLWYAVTFINYYQSGVVENIFSANSAAAPDHSTWNIILASASVTYLLLFIIPVYRFFKNWQYLQQVRTQGLHKPGYEHRLFVKRIAALLGIKANVQLYLSDIVSSPITIGYLKPIILLPVAAINNLSTKQTEAILLHELSHIKRYDYLVNIIVTFVSTFFYYNPFIKKFISVIEAEREACCDDLVLQFEYDRMSYASALFLLEQNNASMRLLTIAAAQKKHLLNRIKKIVGLHEKRGFTFRHFAGLCMSFLIIMVLNVLFIASKPKKESLAFNGYTTTFLPFANDKKSSEGEPAKNEWMPKHIQNSLVEVHKKQPAVSSKSEPVWFAPDESEPAVLNATPVLYDATLDKVSEEQKEHIATTIAATKKVLGTTQWKVVEQSIADGMTSEEKEIAKQEYLNELNQLDWKKLETKLAVNYDSINWVKVNTNLTNALINIKLDSAQQCYKQILEEIEKSSAAAKADKAVLLPLPDATVQQVAKAKQEIQMQLDSIKIIRTKKVVKL